MDYQYSVSEFIEFINYYLEGVNEVLVQGEISEINLSQGKWFFIKIKDETSSVEVFATAFQNPVCRQLAPGMLINVYGIPKLYKKTAKFSIQATRIVPAGEGNMLATFEKLKQKLELEGFFDESRKRKITRFPQQIGLITAKDSQAYKDFVKVLGERMGGVKIYFYPVSVQGKDSVSSIVDALAFFNKADLKLDALVLTRGGGSIEDLYSFNTEEVARAVFLSKTPVVCGVGHEGDVSLADLCSDVRASTPSNAAELICREVVETLTDISHMEYKLMSQVKARMAVFYSKVDQFAFASQNKVFTKIGAIQNTLASFDSSLIQFEHLIQNRKSLANAQAVAIIRKMESAIKLACVRIEATSSLLAALDYNKMLKKGFAVVYNESGKIIKDVKNVKINSLLTIMMAKGVLISKVEGIQHDSK